MARDEFFIEENLCSGMEIVFPKFDLSHVEFLSHQEAESLPFSTKKLLEFFTHFGVPQNPDKVSGLNNTLKICEVVEYEKKLCASLLEAMLKFVVSLLGHDDKVYSSQKEDSTTSLKIFAREVVTNDVLVCHKMNYPYVVYLCHSSKETMPSTKTILSAAASTTTTVVLVRSIVKDYFPQELCDYVYLKPKTFLTSCSSKITLVIEEYDDDEKVESSGRVYDRRTMGFITVGEKGEKMECRGNSF